MAAVKRMDSVKKAAEEISEWRAKREQFATELQAAHRAAEDAGKAREKLLLGALAAGDPEARTELADNTVVLVRAEREERDLTTLLAQIDGKLAGLEREHAAAKRADAVVRLREMSGQRLAVDATIERLVTELIPAVAEWLQRATDMASVAEEWQFSGAEAYGRRFTLAAYVGAALHPFGLLATRTLPPEHRVANLVESDREALESLLGRLEAPGPAAKQAA